MLTDTAKSRRYYCDVASSGDDDEIRRLLRYPMPGRVALSLQQEPNHRLAADIQGDKRLEVVVRDRQAVHHIAGYGERSVRNLWINGESKRVGYLGGLRCDGVLRVAYRVLGTALADLSHDRTREEVTFDLTSIMADNTAMRQVMERGLPGLPQYVPVGEMVTLTLRAARQRHELPISVRPATREDMPLLVERLATHGQKYNALPVWTEKDLLSPILCRDLEARNLLIKWNGDRIAGCLAVWDQRAFKQIVVHDLTPSLRQMRWCINAVSKVTGHPAIPPPNSELPMVYASHMAFDEHDLPTITALLDAARMIACNANAKLLSFGLPASHALVSRIQKRYRAWTSRSIIYAVAASVSAVSLDHRPLWMEIAVL